MLTIYILFCAMFFFDNGNKFADFPPIPKSSTKNIKEVKKINNMKKNNIQMICKKKNDIQIKTIKIILFFLGEDLVLFSNANPFLPIEPLPVFFSFSSPSLEIGIEEGTIVTGLNIFFKDLMDMSDGFLSMTVEFVLGKREASFFMLVFAGTEIEDTWEEEEVMFVLEVAATMSFFTLLLCIASPPPMTKVHWQERLDEQNGD